MESLRGRKGGACVGNAPGHKWGRGLPRGQCAAAELDSPIAPPPRTLGATMEEYHLPCDEVPPLRRPRPFRRFVSAGWFPGTRQPGRKEGRATRRLCCGACVGNASTINGGGAPRVGQCAAAELDSAHSSAPQETRRHHGGAPSPLRRGTAPSAAPERPPPPPVSALCFGRVVSWPQQPAELGCSVPRAQVLSTGPGIRPSLLRGLDPEALRGGVRVRMALATGSAGAGSGVGTEG